MRNADRVIHERNERQRASGVEADKGPSRGYARRRQVQNWISEMTMLDPRIRMLTAFFWLLSGCASDEFTAAQRGRALFNDQALSDSPKNEFTCTTCHDLKAGQSGITKAGAPLAGVTERPSYWGGSENDLLASVNACLRYFMLSTELLTETDEDARALYAFFDSLEPRDTAPVPFTIVRTIEDVPRGDASIGAPLYAQVCGTCHGQPTTGKDRLTRTAPILPEDTIEEHIDYSPRLLRLVFIEKTRHGPFLGYGGNMAPFSREKLSDEDLGAILEYLDILGQ